MDNIGLKKKYSSLKMDNITVIKLKAFAKMATIENRIRLNCLKMLMYRTTWQHNISHGITQAVPLAAKHRGTDWLAKVADAAGETAKGIPQ